MQYFSTSSVSKKTLSKLVSPQFNFRTYFMKGLENEHLTQNKQKDFLRFPNDNPQGSSFMVYTPKKLQDQIQQWRTNLPWISPFYAMKSNPIAPLIQDIAANKMGFDCASKSEIQTALDLGTDPSKIVFSNSVKEERDIQFALEKGVLLTTADTFDELKKIQRVSSDFKILWRISIKENNAEKLATIFSNKFGDDLDSIEEADVRFKQIRNMGIKIHGIHFHCGSGPDGSSNFARAIDMAKACIVIGRKHGHHMELLNMGGGYPSGALPKNLVADLSATRNDPLGFEVMAEPGRYMSSNTCHLGFRVLGKRVKSGKKCYHVNDSLYHSFNCNLMDGVTFEHDKSQFYSSWENEDSRGDIKDDDLHDGSIFGMTCDGYDIIANNIKVPEMEVGDWMMMGGMGSYTFGPKSLFNGMTSLERIFVYEDQSQLTQNAKIGRAHV